MQSLPTLETGPTEPLLRLLIDHDNVDLTSSSLSSLLIKWIAELDQYLAAGSVITVRVRAYGGWFSGVSASEARYKAAQFYQSQLPSAFRADGHLCRLAFEFADYLSQSTDGIPPHRVSSTVVTRSKPMMMKQRQPRLSCQLPGCELDRVRKWLQKAKACSHPDCPHPFTDAFERLEQKQVDVHIALDLVHFSENAREVEHIALVSDDLDLLPALVAAKRRLRTETSTITVIRSLAPSAYMTDTLADEGVLLLRSGGGT
jgi:uncharacterized LabA/DUF88 family protein